MYTSLGLSTLGFTQLLEPVGFCLLPYFFKDWLGQNFVGFFHIFPIFHKISISLWKNPTYFLGSPVLLQAPVVPFPFTSGIPVAQIPFVVVPHIPEDPFIYFTFCFISVVKIGSFLLSSSLLILPSVPTILLWVHILSFFIQLLYFSVLKFLFGSLYLLFLCSAFLFLFLRLSVFPVLLCIVACWSLFLMAAPRSLSDNSGSFPRGLQWHSKDEGCWNTGPHYEVTVLNPSLTFHDTSAEYASLQPGEGGSLGFPFSLCWHEWGWGHGFLHSG